MGNDGVITIEESKGIERIRCCRRDALDRGYHHNMVTDNDKMIATLDNPFILITDKKVSNIQEIIPLLEQIVQQGRVINHRG